MAANHKLQPRHAPAPSPTATRAEIAELVAWRLEGEAERLAEAFRTPGQVPSCHIDDLLPRALAHEIHERFPATDRMVLKRSIKEHKRVAAQMDDYDPLLEEAIYAFQDPRVVGLVQQITGLQALEPDADLYAGGLSTMTKGGYLRPHLDNSHDGGQGRYRVLNLLYYVTPGWRPEYGGSLQLWDEGPLKTTRTIVSRFNRLVLMETNRSSWHSVNQIVHDGARCCVSNYYFSAVSPDAEDYFHATTFRGEHAGPDDLIMQIDNALRTKILKSLPGLYRNPHVYKRAED
jgi:Rps23 Pro-64 3,4-dihydroxylase Tpa1-like proline 4-hydroxylase